MTITAAKRSIGVFYARPHGATWRYIEESLLAELVREDGFEKELEELKAFHASLPLTDRRYFPNSVLSLLRSWTETLDRARMLKTLKPKTMLDKDIAKILKGM